MTHDSTCEGSTCSTEAITEYGTSRPMFWKPSVASVSRRILRSNCALSSSEEGTISIDMHERYVIRSYRISQ